jgi:phosphatidylserine/phosphatidylglycerophosphate/cardiolipin synthase-like enzyme
MTPYGFVAFHNGNYLQDTSRFGRWRKIVHWIHGLHPRFVLWIAVWIGSVLLPTFAGCQPSSPGASSSPGATSSTLPPVEIFFSPHGGCTEAAVREIDAARSVLLVQAYSFTSTPIAKALVAAHRRGVKVRVILDKENETEKYSAAVFLIHEGVPTQIDAKHAIAHNKIMIIDEQTVITGSFNFTKQAETSNAENLLVIRDAKIAARYIANWREHAEHSQEYRQKIESRESSSGRSERRQRRD